MTAITEYPLSAEQFINLIYNLQTNSIGFFFFWQRNQGAERVNALSKIMQLANGRAGIHM